MNRFLRKISLSIDIPIVPNNLKRGLIFLFLSMPILLTKKIFF